MSETKPSLSPKPREKRRSNFLFTFLKIAIAIAGIWFVVRGVYWNDSATLEAQTTVREVMFREETHVRVLAQSTTATGGTVLQIEFPTSLVKVHVETRSGPHDVEMVIDENTLIPGTSEALNLPRVIELDGSHFKKGEDQHVDVHEGLRSIGLRAGARWQLLLCAWLILGIPYLVTAIRWRGLMVPQGIRMPLSKCLQLTFVGQFYSIILPGITGGDLVKIVYTARLTGSKTKSFITIILDRVIGLVALMTIAGVSAGVQLALNSRNGVAVDGTLLNVFLMIVVMLVALTIGCTVYFSRRLRKLAGIDWFIDHFTQLADADDPASEEHRKLERLFRVTNGALLALAVAVAGTLAVLRWGVESDWAMNNTILVFAGMIGSLVLAAAAMTAFILHNAMAHRITPLMRKAVGGIIGVDETLHVYRGHFGLLGWAFFISVISQLSLPLSAWLSGQALGMHAPVTHYLAYLPVAVLASSLPISPPQGLGLLEGVLNHFFVSRGAATASQVFALTQSVRFLPILWNLMGAYWVVTGQYSRREVPAAADPVPASQ